MKGSSGNIKRAVYGLLIGLYATIYVGWDMVHAHVHQDAQTAHSAQIEKDPCHRSIFHGETDAHKNHVSENKTCASCHVVSQLPFVTNAVVLSPEYHEKVYILSRYSSFIEESSSSLLPSRAPPAIV